jgi:alpha-tubulin suppressor-like RCC1 family protein
MLVAAWLGLSVSGGLPPRELVYAILDDYMRAALGNYSFSEHDPRYDLDWPETWLEDTKNYKPVKTLDEDPILAFPSVTAGLFHTCTLNTRGIAKCFGDNTYGQTNVPAGIGFVSLSAGDSHTCGIDPNGTAHCWGENTNGQCDPPAGVLFALVSSGARHTCGISRELGVGIRVPTNKGLIRGTPHCWGAKGFGQTDVPPGVPEVISISSATWHTCAVTPNGEAICWGTKNSYAPLWRPYSFVGYRPTTPKMDPSVAGRAVTKPPSGVEFRYVACGAFHCCGIDVGRKAHCWGSPANGATQPPADVSFALTSISAGAWQTCGLDVEGIAHCWGESHRCAPLISPLPRPPPPPTLWPSLPTPRHPALRYGPTRIPHGKFMYESISTGGHHRCGVNLQGTAVCWGDDGYGQTCAGSPQRLSTLCRFPLTHSAADVGKKNRRIPLPPANVHLLQRDIDPLRRTTMMNRTPFALALLSAVCVTLSVRFVRRLVIDRKNLLQ